MTLDEIYDSFIYNESDEYKTRVARGIEEACSYKNLYPFIQPIILPTYKSKSVWEPCAIVISSKTDEELSPYLTLLFEWLQDKNWPGAEIILERLKNINYAVLEDDLKFAIQRARKEEHFAWMDTLNDLKKSFIA